MALTVSVPIAVSTFAGKRPLLGACSWIWRGLDCWRSVERVCLILGWAVSAFEPLRNLKLLTFQEYCTGGLESSQRILFHPSAATTPKRGLALFFTHGVDQDVAFHKRGSK
eukprot:140796-Amphidinium_carterae.1